MLAAGNISFGLFLSQNLIHLYAVLLKIVNLNNAWDFLIFFLINPQCVFLFPKISTDFLFFMTWWFKLFLNRFWSYFLGLFILLRTF